MPNSRGHISAKPGRLEALQARHMAVNTELEEEQKHSSVSDESLRRLKAEKLKLKDEIEEQKRIAVS